MALKYPAFDRTVWNFVKPDLSIVDTYLQYQESKAKVNSLTVERNAKAMKERTDVSYLVEDVMDAAKRINWYEKTDAKRQDGLRIGLKKYQELKSTPYSSPVIRHELAKVVEEIARSYFMFQVNKLRD